MYTPWQSVSFNMSHVVVFIVFLDVFVLFLCKLSNVVSTYYTQKHTTTHILEMYKPRGVGYRTRGFEMQIGKQWQHLTKRSVKECVFSQQGKPHTPTGTGKLTSLPLSLALLFIFLLSALF